MQSVRRLRDKAFNGYLKNRIPHELDERVSAVVNEYRSGSPAARRAMLDELDPDGAGTLSAYGERMAAVAVRTGDQTYLRDGLVAMGMAEAVLADPRDNLVALAAVNDGAERLDTDLAALVDSLVEELPDSAVATFRAFADRAAEHRSLQSMGLATYGSGDGFRYVSGPTG